MKSLDQRSTHATTRATRTVDTCSAAAYASPTSSPLHPSLRLLIKRSRFRSLLDQNARVLGFGSVMAVPVANSEALQSQPWPGGGILARVDRLDIMLGYLEELRGRHSSSSTSVAAVSGDSGAVTTSEVSNFSVDSSPRSADQHQCRPIGAVVVETQVKGNLLDRVEYLEKRLLKASYYTVFVYTFQLLFFFF